MSTLILMVTVMIAIVTELSMRMRRFQTCVNGNQEHGVNTSTGTRFLLLWGLLISEKTL